jgi:hypothetical protein
MKTSVGKLVVLTLCVLTVGVAASQAQITNQLDFKVSQPFTVANTTLPAGSYTVRPVQGTEGAVVEISSESGHPSVMVDTVSAQPDGGQSGSHLVFNKYKNVLALSQIFPGGGAAGYTLVQGHPEQMAAKAEKPTTQTVASTAK